MNMEATISQLTIGGTQLRHINLIEPIVLNIGRYIGISAETIYRYIGRDTGILFKTIR